ncbi:MAG: hypothetical protein EHM60_07600 [Lysobacterales bacterium]|nr:MAG: hypothetical protein EHM60_07600 [Xanthomonadales bacterium]
MIRALPCFAVCVFALTALTGVAACAATLDETRREFQAAYAAVRLAPLNGLAPADSEALRDYPLYPYLQAARLQRRIDDPAAAPEIEAFIVAHGDQPAARSLRRTWLMSLAERKAWGGYLDVYDAAIDDTAAARCNALAARVALGRTTGLADEVTQAWLAPKSVPPACDPAFDWARSQGLLTPELTERRARLALAAGEAGLARFLAKSLAPAQAAPINQWAGLIERPSQSIEALIAAPTRAVEPAALLDGWTRYARNDPEAASASYAGFVRARGLDAAAASPYALALALPLSWRRDGRALGYFSQARAADYDERAHEWHVRAALWAGDWARVRTAIAAMPQPLREQNRWRYWEARSAEQLGDETAARAGYEAVLPTDNWYATLSAARLGRRFEPTPRRIPRDAAELAKVTALPGLVRTHELILVDMDAEARTEWNAALEDMTPAQQTQAVHLASGWGWHLQAIAAAAKLGQFDDYELLYPRPFDTEVRRAAAQTGLPQPLIYAVIRQESLFRADAASSAGALGLMQLLPSTATLTARKIGQRPPTRTELLIPSVNVPLGGAFLQSLIARADGQLPVAIAGYNAGPAAARRWLVAAPVETDVWVENIPFNETRAYVQRVSWHTLVFTWLDDRKARDVSGWLGTVRLPGVDAALEPAG